VTRPTLFLAGEAGPEEYAFSGAGGSLGGNVTNIYVAGSVITERELSRMVSRTSDSDLRLKYKLPAA